MAGIPEPAAGAEARAGRETAAITSEIDRRRTNAGTGADAPRRAPTHPRACTVRAVSGFADGERRAPLPSVPAPPGRPASLARRLGALLYEALLLVAMAFVAGFLLLPLVSPMVSIDRVPAIPPVFARTIMFCALAGGAAIYYRWCWSEGRRTLPQKTWGLRLTDAAGRSLTRRTALVRYAAGWIGPVAALAAYGALRPVGVGPYAGALLLLNYAWGLADPSRQFLHDRIAGTRVVQDPDVPTSAQ